MTTLNVNGKNYTVTADPGTPLLWVIRDVIGLTGTKYGCGIEVCGACTIWIDGSPERSCEMTIAEGVGVKITTVEGLSPTSSHPIQKAWVAEQVPQCGYCQSGQIMVAASMIAGGHKPTDAQITAGMGNLCVCGTYNRIRAAIHLAAGG